MSNSPSPLFSRGGSCLFLFFLIFGFSCNDESSARRSSIVETGIESKPVFPKSSKLSWEDSFREIFREPYEKKEDGSLLFLKLKNQEPFTAESFDRFVVGLGVRLASADTPFKAVILQGGGSDESIFKARFYLADLLAYKKGEISQPELLRRFEIEVVETVESLRTKVKAARKEGRNQDSEAALLKWTALEPSSSLAWSLLGNVYRDTRKYFEAISAYKKVLEIGPNSLFALQNLAVCSEKIGAFDDSIAFYKTALEGDRQAGSAPQNVLLMQQLADVYRRDGDTNAAMVWIGKARGIKDSADLWMVEGNVNRDSKKYAKAREAYLKAQKMNPADTRILFNLLLIDLDTKNFAGAKKKFAELKIKDPKLAGELGGVYVFQESENE